MLDSQVKALLIPKDISSEESADEWSQDVASSVLRGPIGLVSAEFVHISQVLPADLGQRDRRVEQPPRHCLEGE